MDDDLQWLAGLDGFDREFLGGNPPVRAEVPLAHDQVIFQH
jgi:hypothetical protein